MAHAFEETVFHSFGKFGETQSCVLESTRKDFVELDPDRTLGVERLQLVVDEDHDTGTWTPLREMRSSELVVRPKERGCGSQAQSPGARIRDGVPAEFRLPMYGDSCGVRPRRPGIGRRVKIGATFAGVIVVLLLIGKLLVEGDGGGGGGGGESPTTPPPLRTTTRGHQGGLSTTAPPPDVPEGFGPSLVLDVELYVCGIFGRLKICVSEEDGRCVVRRSEKTVVVITVRKVLREVEGCLGFDVFVEI